MKGIDTKIQKPNKQAGNKRKQRFEAQAKNGKLDLL
jgi:hypothetical protein